MAVKGYNALSYPQKKACEKAMLSHIESDYPPFATYQSLAEVLQQTLGFDVTKSNVRKLIQECELDKDKLIKKGRGNIASSSQLLEQLEILKIQYDALSRRMSVIESLLELEDNSNDR